MSKTKDIKEKLMELCPVGEDPVNLCSPEKLLQALVVYRDPEPKFTPRSSEMSSASASESDPEYPKCGSTDEKISATTDHSGTFPC